MQATRNVIKHFIERANANHPTIKFTTEVSPIETTFLDTTVYKRERFEKKSILDVRTHFKLLKHFSAHTSIAVTQQALKKVLSKERLSGL